LLAVEAEPTCCFGGSGCGFRETLLAVEAEPTFCFGGSGCGFNATLLAVEAEPFCTLPGTRMTFFWAGALVSETWDNADTLPITAIRPIASKLFMFHPECLV